MEFDYVTIYIKYPYNAPYDLMLPQIPEYLGIPNPVESGYIEQYLPYLMTGDSRKVNEDYTYGERLFKIFDGYSNEDAHPIYYDQVSHYIKLLKKTPNTNQAILQVADPRDHRLGDPPCLRHIDMRIKKRLVDGMFSTYVSELIFYPYFRSWDLWGGFPANLAAIAVLQKYMADEIGVDAGPICASSKGLHIYGYVEELAKLRCGK